MQALFSPQVRRLEAKEEPKAFLLEGTMAGEPSLIQLLVYPLMTWVPPATLTQQASAERTRLPQTKEGLFQQQATLPPMDAMVWTVPKTYPCSVAATPDYPLIAPIHLRVMRLAEGPGLAIAKLCQQWSEPVRELLWPAQLHQVVNSMPLLGMARVHLVTAQTLHLVCQAAVPSLAEQLWPFHLELEHPIAQQDLQCPPASPAGVHQPPLQMPRAP